MLTIIVDSATFPDQQPAYQGKYWQRSCSIHNAFRSDWL